MQWDGFDLDPLAEHFRQTCTPSDASRMLYAFEQTIALAQRDPELLAHLFAAVASLIAYAEGTSPRTVLETHFRRAVTDEQWGDVYLPLFE